MLMEVTVYPNRNIKPGLAVFKAAAEKLHSIVTGDEKWIYFGYPKQKKIMDR